MTGGRALSLVAGVAVLALTAWFAWRGERFIEANGPTFDEGVHLTSGYAYWKAGEFRLNGEDPPLFKLLWALPLLFRDAPPFPPAVSPEFRSNLWHVGDAWMYGTNIPPRALLDTARRVNLTFGCALVLLIGWVGYRVWGSKLAGVAACAFAAADPTLLALSCVLSTDLGVTLFGLLTCYLMWEYASHPSRGLVVGLGVGAGLML
ncbi:MAG TPA: hypothetical protein VLM40_03370, partial [Gemmata sp.]|nr:hypothetical protein [Gemmata sp.]